MLKHVVLMKFKPGVTDDQIRDLAKSLGALPALIPEIKEFTFGRDLRPEKVYDFALVSSFDDFAALNRYRPHPEHMAILKKVKAMCEQIQVVDFEY
jgi:hypothetical protein